MSVPCVLLKDAYSSVISKSLFNSQIEAKCYEVLYVLIFLC